jgi:hypothetical protein
LGGRQRAQISFWGIIKQRSNGKIFAKQRGFWQSKTPYMRILGAFFRCLCPCVIVAGLPFLSLAADKPENVVLQYHFAGATQLAEDTNIIAAKEVFALKSTVAFKNVVLNQLATNLAAALHFQTDGAAVSALRPLLDDILLSESMASAGGSPDKPLDFVFAVELNAQRAQAWQHALQALNNGAGKEFHAETYSGRRWKNGEGESFWVVPARDWLVAGRGESLASVRSDYLQQIQKYGRPAPALATNCFEADADWPRLAHWFSLASFPLKLGRTQVGISTAGGNFFMAGHVTYPEAIPWQPHAMIFPTNLVREPLLSFVTGQDVAPFLKSDETLSRFCTDPLRDQFYFWSMSELAFESFAAWPVSDTTNTMKTLATQVLPDLNPRLKELDGTDLAWKPRQSRIVWLKLPLITPSVLPAPAPATNGQFLLAALFPLTPGKGPAPATLWAQLAGRTNLVYYDWELTGPRVRHLLSLTQVVPILQMLDVGPRETSPGTDPRLAIEEIWLANLTPFLSNTATEVTKTGPNELTVTRNSPFVFSSLELVLLSHWLSDTPAGPLDKSLLPFAKMSGPGVPSQ